MSNFIQKVVSTILKSEKKIENQIIILPSKRAGVFFKNELINQLDINTWSPKILTIEELISDISSLNVINNIQLLFEYYTVYLNQNKESEKDSFDKFTKWANIALYDFNEIDRYLVDPTKVFKNLQDIKKIENWDLDKPTDLINKFMSFWHNLESQYYELNEILKSKNMAYQGMAFRYAAENIDKYIYDSVLENDHFHFVGFNAINNAEEKIITKLLECDKADVYWDADKYYFDDKIQEAGIFLRRHKKNWKHFKTHQFNWVEDNFDRNKKIEIIGVPKSVGQAKVAGELLSKLYDNKSNTILNTALVLADENLLLPCLNSLPQEVDKVNITMGYPISNSPLAGLFELIFKLHEKIIRLNRQNEEKPFYSKDVIKIVKHPTISQIIEFEKGNSTSIIENIISNNLVFVDSSDIKFHADSKLLDTIFSNWNNDSNNALSNCLDMIKTIKSIYTKRYSEFSIELEYLFRLSQIFNQLISLNRKYPYLKDIKTLISFYKQLLNTEALSFRGEPLEGLQLMGMLETRLLDFENVILTSVNEGVLPSSSADNSFIPYDLKIDLGLPTYTEKDAIYSYHFYRLIQKSKKVYLLYNTETDEFGSGEKSRFITQLLYESKADIKEFVFSAKPDVKIKENISVVKNENVMQRLDSLAESGFSPSSLSSYMRDPLTFYYQKIVGLKEHEEIEETADYRTLGDIIHHVLEEIYTPYLNKVLSIENINEMQKLVKEQSAKSFKLKYLNGDYSSGKNHLILKMVEEISSNYLKHEKSLIQSGKTLKIIALEKRLETNLYLKEINKEVLIKGYIDRIDQLDEVVRILDYKTGKVIKSDLEIKDFDSIIEDEGKPKALQLLIYAMMFNKDKELQQYSKYPLKAGIIPLKNSGDSLFPLMQNRKDFLIDDIIIKDVNSLVSNLLYEIYNPELKFEERENTNH